jgi:uncharacterized delta-60 repeat protein
MLKRIRYRLINDVQNGQMARLVIRRKWIKPASCQRGLVYLNCEATHALGSSGVKNMAIGISNRLRRSFQHGGVLIALMLLTVLAVPIDVWAAVSVDTEGFSIRTNFYNPDDWNDNNSSVNTLALQNDGKILFGGKFTHINDVESVSTNVGRLNVDGSVDASFAAQINGSVSHLALQNDGKVVIGGNFTEIAGTPRNHIARLNSNGSLDAGYIVNITGLSYSPRFSNKSLQADGKLIITGDFTEINGIARDGFARLNADGSLDASFNPNINGGVYSAILQLNGKILIIGNFTEIDGIPRSHLARLNGDGSLDVEFESASFVTSEPYGVYLSSIALQNDGMILIGGRFDEVNNVARNGIVRFYADGSLDINYVPAHSLYGSIGSITIQPDGKAIITNDDINTEIDRLNQDGTKDLNFIPPDIHAKLNGDEDFINSVAIQGDGKIILGTHSWMGTGIPDDGYVLMLNSDGSFDQGFNYDAGTDAYSTIKTLARQTNGKILIGGEFNEFNGIGRTNIARLLPDGNLDLDFHPIVNGQINVIKTQADGKILIGGYFNSVNGIEKIGIARLNPDGSVDPYFSSILDNYDYVNSMALQDDGKILVGNSNGVFRLHAYGSIDPSFNCTLSDCGPAYAMALQDDGKIIIGGSFSNGAYFNNIARLNPDGSYDGGFSVNVIGTVYSIVIQPDDKILAAGYFDDGGGVFPHEYITRFNQNGSIDLGFDSRGFTDLYQYMSIHTVELQEDNKILVGGSFNNYNGTAPANIARLTSDGTLDIAFDVGSGPDSSVFNILLQPDNKILISGGFSTVDNEELRGIARLNTNGNVDASFLYKDINNWVQALSSQVDGSLLIGGFFTDVHGSERNYIARLIKNSSLDTTFDPGAGANDWVSSIAQQLDGKILIGGNFTEFDGVSRKHLARLHEDGSLDIGFEPSPSVVTDKVRAIAQQPDGKILVGGLFGLARLNPNGGQDVDFNLGTGVNFAVFGIAQQLDGKILIAGSFTDINGVSRNRIARLNADGSVDTGFNPGTGANGNIYSLLLQPDGKVLIGGNFTNVNGVPHMFVSRLNSNGTVDMSFNPGTNLDDLVLSMALQEDGKVVIGGFFTKYGTTSRNRIARLNPDGSLDADFDLGTGANGSVETMAIQSDGSIVIGGHFTEVDGIEQNYISRLSQSEAALQQLSVSTDGASVSWLGGGVGPLLERVTFEVSDSPDGSWMLLGSGVRTASGWILDGLNFPVGQNLYIRARGYYGSNAGSMMEIIIQFYLEKPSILVSITAEPSVLKEPGGAVTLTLSIDNTSATNEVNINTLMDSIYGNLNGVGSCTVPKHIIAGNRYNCAYEGDISGDAGYNEVHKVTAIGADEYGNLVSGNDSNTVKIIPANGCIPYLPEGKMLMICW